MSPEVKSDHTVETHHHRRVIRLKKGQFTEETKKDQNGRRTKFDVTDLTIFWREGEEPKEIIIWGHTKVKGIKLNCHRRYKLKDAPIWVKPIILGVDNG